MRILLPNLNFEEELQHRTLQTAATARAVAELAPMMAFLARPGDCLLVPAIPDAAWRDTFFPQVDFVDQPSAVRERLAPGAIVEVLPWGWSPIVRRIVASQFKLPIDAPSELAVRCVNGRSFSSRFDPVKILNRQDVNDCQEAFGRYCLTESQWEEAVGFFRQQGHDRWVTKPEISHAGRNRLIGDSKQLNQQQAGWLKKQLKNGGVYVEPWVSVTAECGLQFEIASPQRRGEIRLVGVTQLLNDRMGRYLGSIISPSQQVESGWQSAIEHGYAVCEAAAETGYWGPLGIDAYEFRHPDGHTALRLCNDINGRHTMGRLALELCSSLLPGEFGLWMQISGAVAADFLANIREIPMVDGLNDVRFQTTSPSLVGSEPVRTSTILLSGADTEQLRIAAERIREETR